MNNDNRIRIYKNNGELAPLDVTKIHKVTKPATAGLDNVSQSDLEVQAEISFIDKMKSSDITKSLISAAIGMIDIDKPMYTYVAARLTMYELYHLVGRNTGGVKGTNYKHLGEHIKVLQDKERYIKGLADGYDIDDLNDYIDQDRDDLFTYLGIKSLIERYLSKSRDGVPLELPQHFFMCIAMFLAKNESPSVKQQRAKEFYDVISKFEVMLATPTLSNARTNRHQLSSCYIGATPDTIEGIFDAYHEMALLSKYGGGIGWDWTDVRALGGVIADHKGAAGGTVPFLKINNDLAIAVDQLGTRKGAIGVYVEPWHMDIIDFIDLKKNSGEERRRAHDLFPALWIPDIFMERILDDGYWTLFDPHEVPDLHRCDGEEFENKYRAYETDPSIGKDRIKAKDLWKKILTSYFESGSPFLCFKDTANRNNPNSHVGKIRSSNLCTEIFQNTAPDTYKIKVEFENGDYITVAEEDLIGIEGAGKVKGKFVTSLDVLEKTNITTNDGILLNEMSADDRRVYCIGKVRTPGKTAVCNLASVNMSRINTPEDIERVVPIAVRMLDNVIDLNYYPVRKVKDTNMESRSIGLGAMGSSEYLACNEIHWGSDEHYAFMARFMEKLSYETIKASSDLALEKGSYKTFEGSKWSQGMMPFDNITPSLKTLMSSKDIPVETLDWDWLREKVMKDGMRNGYLMAIAPTSSISILVGTTQALEPIYKRKWFEENLMGLLPVVAPNLSPKSYNYYKPAFDIDQMNVVIQSAIVGLYIDQGHSTNIFINSDKASGKYLNDIYILGWRLGCKSFYYLRSQSPEATTDTVDRSMECSGCQ